jgi:hypothetical protein
MDCAAGAGLGSIGLIAGSALASGRGSGAGAGAVSLAGRRRSLVQTMSNMLGGGAAAGRGGGRSGSGSSAGGAPTAAGAGTTGTLGRAQPSCMGARAPAFGRAAGASADSGRRAGCGSS